MVASEAGSLFSLWGNLAARSGEAGKIFFDGTVDFPLHQEWWKTRAKNTMLINLDQR
jgi:hypothetical protein